MEEGKNRFIQAFVPQPTIEALNEGILRRLARFDKTHLNVMFLAPVEHGLRGKFGAVIRQRDLWPAVLLDEPVQEVGDPLATDGEVHPYPSAFPRTVIDHGQAPEPSSVHQLIRYEVHRPALVRGQGHRDG